MYSPKFQTAIAFVLKWECVFAPGHDGDMAYVIAEHDPGDPGGVTKYGIDARDHPGVDVEALDLAGAMQIYHDGLVNGRGEIYAGGEWTECNCEHMPDRWALAVFDLAVNPGGIARKWLQIVLGCPADGVIGPFTLGAVNAASDTQLAALINRAEIYYRTLVEKQPHFQDDLAGWLNRLADLRKTLGLPKG